jgi:quercetin dioxygenase-like cupin family protein
MIHRLKEPIAMRVKQCDEVPASDVTMDGAAGCRVRWLIAEVDQAPNFAMREFEVAPGGHTPKHVHDYEHEVYVLAGQGVIAGGEHDQPLWPGSVVYVAPNKVHQFRNTGPEPLRFLCLIPNSAASKSVTIVPC